MENLAHRWPQSEHFPPKLGHFFPIFEKGQGRPPPLPPAPPYSYTSVFLQMKIAAVVVHFLKWNVYCCSLTNVRFDVYFYAWVVFNVQNVKQEENDWLNMNFLWKIGKNNKFVLPVKI